MIHPAGVELMGSVTHTEVLHTVTVLCYDPSCRCRTRRECGAHRDVTPDQSTRHSRGRRDAQVRRKHRYDQNFGKMQNLFKPMPPPNVLKCPQGGHGAGKTRNLDLTFPYRENAGNFDSVQRFMNCGDFWSVDGCMGGDFATHTSTHLPTQWNLALAIKNFEFHQ